MKPPRWQYVYAHILGIVAGVSSVVFAAFVAWHCWEGVPSLVSAFWLVCAAIVALPIGWLLGFLILVTFGPLIYWMASKFNGAPFRPGDWVRILAGAHRDRVLRVAAVWEERGSVVVDAGEHVAGDTTEISQIRICREIDA